MYKSAFTTILFFTFYTGCFAQQTALDSCLKALANHPAEDTIRLNILHDIVYHYFEINPDKGIATSAEEMALAKKIKNKKRYGYGLSNMGLCYWAKANYPEALLYYDSALKIFEDEKFKKGISSTLIRIGNTYMYLSNYPKALNVFFKSLQIKDSLKDVDGIGEVCGNIGIVYHKMKQFTKSIGYFSKATSLYETVDDKESEVRNFQNIGNVYDDLDSSAKALEYYKLALSKSKEISFTKGVANCYSNMAIAYISLGNYTDAYKCLQTALPILTEAKDKINIAIVLSTMGDIMVNAPDAILKKLNIAVAGKYSKALGYYSQSLQSFEEAGDIFNQASTWENISKVYEKENNFKAALDAYKKYSLLQDSIINDDKKEVAAKIEMQYSFDKKEDSIKNEADKKTFIASAEIRRQSTIKKSIAAGAFILLLAAITSFVFYKRRRDELQQQKEIEFKAQVSDTEMKALRAQMNPHFIFNSLNSIGNYIIKNEPEKATEYLSKFANLMRMILENSEQKDVTIADDLKALEIYMQLEALRMNNKFTYEIKVDEAIDKENTLIPPLILQPFVENSIWHGFEQKQTQGKISISIKKEDDLIKCIVEDNGIGRIQSSTIKNEQTGIAKKSLGMKITNARIDIINKVNNSNAAVELFDMAEGMRVEVKLPLTLAY